MKMKKVISLLLCCVMLTGVLAGCGGEEQKKEETITAYMPTFHEVALKDANGIMTSVLTDETVYFVAYVPGGTYRQMDETGTISEVEADRTALFRVKRDGTGLEEMTAFHPTEIPEDRLGGSNVSRIALDKDGNLAVLETVNTYYYDLPADFVPGTQDFWQYYTDEGSRSLLRFLNADGSENRSIDLSAIAAKLSTEDHSMDGVSYSSVYDFAFDDQGNIYFYDGYTLLIVLDPSGEPLGTIPCDGSIAGVNGFVRLADGRLAASTYGEKTELRVVDLAKKQFGEAIPTPGNFGQLIAGRGDNLYFFTTESGVGACKADGTIENLLFWINADVDGSNFSGVTFETADKITGIQYDYSDKTMELVDLEKKTLSAADRPKTIRLATMWINYSLRGQIMDFNRANNGYRIEVEDYSVYNTEENWNAGQTVLMTEIASGKMPDILDANMMPYSRLAAKGLLEDLMPLIAADPELGENAFVKPVLEAMKQDGKLYYLSPYFSINTAFSNRRLTGGRDSWTTDEVMEIFRNMPEGSSVDTPYMTQEDLLGLTLTQNMDQFVNWQTGECKFDSPDFIKLLEFSTLAPKTVPQEVYDDWETYNETTYIPEGHQLMASGSLYDFYSYFWSKALWGDDIVMIGRPSETGTGNSFHPLGYGGYNFALSSKCEYKEGAWKFIRQCVMDDDESASGGFPLLQKAFDEKFAEAMKVDPENDAFSYELPSGEVRRFAALSEEDKAQFMNLINTTTKMDERDEELMKIIMDEARSFIDGKSSAKDTAAMMQSRVNIYVNEQR